MRDDWEVSLCSGAPAPALTEDPIGMPDTYCFEMLSLVLALSGSSVGRSYLASQFGLIVDLLTLLHTGKLKILRYLIRSNTTSNLYKYCYKTILHVVTCYDTMLAHHLQHTVLCVVHFLKRFRCRNKTCLVIIRFCFKL